MAENVEFIDCLLLQSCCTQLTALAIIMFPKKKPRWAEVKKKPKAKGSKMLTSKLKSRVNQ